jgi:hypothetical protein
MKTLTGKFRPRRLRFRRLHRLAGAIILRH